MILEALQHLFHPAPHYVKKMGYLHEAIAIENRYKRCARFWLPHINKCKSLISDAVSDLQPHSKITILGSGSLHDVPVDKLVNHDLQTECVDIVHLDNVQKKYPTFNFVQADLTGLAQKLFRQAPGSYFVPETCEPAWMPEPRPDLVISLNLLSQLPIALVEYAHKNRIILPETFETDIYQAHINWLKKTSSRIMIITDIERRYFHKGNLIKTVSAINIHENIIPEPPREQWIWNIAPAGEADNEIGIEHIVGLWSINS